MERFMLIFSFIGVQEDMVLLHPLGQPGLQPLIIFFCTTGRHSREFWMTFVDLP
jgi:hypothetical protein